MSKCSYLYREGDKPVVAGKKKIGDCCDAPSLKSGETVGGMCFGHSVAAGLIPQSKIEAAAAKRRATNLAMPTQDRKKRKTKEDSYDRENDRAKGKKSKYNPTESSMVDEEVLEYLGVNQSYNAKNDYVVTKELNEHPETEDYAKKIVLARWMESKDRRRLPKTIDELAKILDVSPFTLNNWRHSRFVTDMLAQDIRHRATKMEQFVVYHLGVAIKKGDLKAIELYQKFYAPKPEDETRKKAPQVGKELEDEALARLREVEKGMETDKTTRENGLILKDSLISDMYSSKKEEITN